METTTGTTWDLPHLLSVLRRRRGWIAASVLVAVAVSVVLSLVTTPVYQAQAEVLIEPETIQSNPDALGRVFFLEQELQTQQQLMESEAIAKRVADVLSLGGPGVVQAGVVTGVVPDTRVIRVVAFDADPDRAQQLAQTVAEQYLEFRREGALENLIEATSTIENQLEAARAHVADLDQQIEQTDAPARARALSDERLTVAERVSNLQSQLDRLEAADPVARGGGRIIQDAAVPQRPSSPRPVRSAAVALVLGLGVGLVLAVAVEAIDRTVGTVGEVEALTDRPVVGRIPLAGEHEGGDLPMLRHPSGPPAEAFRDLRTNLRFVGRDGPPRTVVVTSPIQGEGKSVVATNLALAAVASGQRVVLVDTDLRRPTVGRMFGFDDQVGLSTVLAQEHTLEEALLELEQPPMTLLLAGARPPNPNELIGSEMMSAVLEQLAAGFDLVIVDTPPVLVVPDVLEVASTADATLLVVELQRSARHEIRDSCQRLQRVGSRLAGIVVNRADLDPMRYGYYYYDDAAG